MNADEVKNVQHNGHDTPSLTHSKKANGTKCMRQSSIHRFFRRLTPRGVKNSDKSHSPVSSVHHSQQSMGDNCARVNNVQPTVANGNLDNVQRSPATSVGADLRRSLNQMFHFGTKSNANRAASDHQLAINRVDVDSADLCPVKLDKGAGETVRSEEDLLVLQGKRISSDSAADKKSSVINSSSKVRAPNMASPSFSSDVLASMTRPLATFCSESNVHHAGELSSTGAVVGPASRAPSYLRVSCAVSGYRDVGRYSASSSPRLLSRPPMVCGRTTVAGSPAADQLFELNSPPSETAIGLSTALGEERSSLVGQKFATPLSIREILESFNRLSLKDNSPVYGLMVAGRRLMDARVSGSSSPESITIVENEQCNCCPLDDGAKQQEQTVETCNTTTTTTTNDDDDNRIVGQNDSYQLLAQQQRKRLEDLCKQAELWQAQSPPEAAAELIRIVIGKVNLLLKKKFRKFEELVDKHMNPVDGEPPIRMDDLEGFWSIVLMEIADVDSCFSAVQKAKDNGWLVEESSSDLTPFRCESRLSEANMDIKQRIKTYKLLLHAVQQLCMLFNLAEDYCVHICVCDSKSSGSTKLRRNSNGKWKTTPTADSDYVTKKRLQGRQFLRAARMKLKQAKEQQQATENKDDIHIFIS
ncbi:Disks large-associated protein 1 [Trichinella papuae]|uniref:Disks large-associated protein 1 n=1 Tax=Trichinella papuae TaxID=268474 RepID=A0A0V1MX49_9BILA|nr:Disks large-associated protein 1 [Trichinella papuae]